MTIYNVTSERFQRYGQVLEGYDFGSFVEVLKEHTPVPEAGTVYEPSSPELEAHPDFEELKVRAYGGMPIQLGFCNGYNRTLNGLEYHKGSEVCIMAYDTILLLGILSDIRDGHYDTKNVEAFLVPAGMGVELYATTLHYAPCSAEPTQCFQAAICLPKGTNVGMPETGAKSAEDKMLRATNKWLIVHEESGDAREGAYIGLIGENITLDK